MITLWHNEARPNGAANTVRPLTHLLDATERRAVMKVTRTCGHPGGCPKPHYGLGWCQMHYRRLVDTGDVGPAAPLPRRPRPSCSLADCGKPHYGQGFCKRHHNRWKRWGDPFRVERGGTGWHGHGPANARWRGADVGYAAVHDRLRRERGRASGYSCHDCGSPADEWSYLGGAPDERIDSRVKFPFSTDLTFYVPRCRSCHRSADAGRT
jgi:hypothetical protein